MDAKSKWQPTLLLFASFVVLLDVFFMSHGLLETMQMVNSAPVESRLWRRLVAQSANLSFFCGLALALLIVGSLRWRVTLGRTRYLHLMIVFSSAAALVLAMHAGFGWDMIFPGLE